MKTWINLCSLLTGCAWTLAGAAGVTVERGVDAAPLRFAAEEIQAAAAGATAGPPLAVSLRVDATALSPQSYRLARDGNTLTVTGGDEAGALYGGLDVAEALRVGGLGELKEGVRAPHISRRGIKFNLPLDLRTPTYSDPSDAAQANLPEMWSLEFWREFLDDMARHRYNVLTLWSLHPFPSLVKVPEFPNVALEDVWRTTAPWDENFSSNGDGFVRPEMLARREVVRKLTIDQKIAFWRAVMQLARDRGVEVCLFTWNVFLYGAEGKDGLTGDKGAPRTIEYFRASVRETIKTYPLLAGLGVTAGESMPEKIGGLSKEQWLWKTYGEGIRDALKDNPRRPFRLIHRFHMTGLGEIRSAFAGLPCPLDLSFKYAIAHMHSVTNPPFIRPALPLLSPELRSWLTVRNDDICSFRWADPDYARGFIRAIPGPDKIAGFYMGPDNYTWGRDFLTRTSGNPRQTVMRKQWLSFALWGRLAFDPDLPDAWVHRLIAARFPGANAGALAEAWADASKTFPWITRFYWGDIDLKWFPEACMRKNRFHTVRDFIEGGTMPGSGVMNILEWRATLLAGRKPAGVTPLDIAATLETNALRALGALPRLRPAAPAVIGNAAEYEATLNDIDAMARLGLYYAAKIRGACDLALFDKSADARQQAAAVRHLESALNHWKDYAAAYTRQYVQPVLYNRTGWVDIPRLAEKAAADVRMAQEWKAGAIDETLVQRSGTEAGYRK